MEGELTVKTSFPAPCCGRGQGCPQKGVRRRKSAERDKINTFHYMRKWHNVKKHAPPGPPHSRRGTRTTARKIRTRPRNARGRATFLLQVLRFFSENDSENLRYSVSCCGFCRFHCLVHRRIPFQHCLQTTSQKVCHPVAAPFTFPFSLRETLLSYRISGVITGTLALVPFLWLCQF